MAEFHVPPDFLGDLRVGSCLGSKDGVACYELLQETTGRRFVLKHISLPASEAKLEALILSGAYPDTASANSYYQHLADDLVDEIRRNQALSDCPNILRFLRHRLEQKEGGVGCDLYVIMPRYETLQQHRSEHALTHLEAMNLGLDLCTALEAVHRGGFVFQDLRPENVFLTETGSWLLGDFGLASMQDMQFGSLPEQYLSEYSAPELGGMLSGLNHTIDVYSLGMLLYRIYNGFHAPFEDEATGGSASEERRRAGEALPAPLYADYELAGILSKACAFRPEDRYQDPAELRAALTDYMRRNEISDQLIVPPIVAGAKPLLEDAPAAEEEPTEPVSFTDVNELDDEFKAHFRPDTASLEAVIAAAREEEAQAVSAPAAEEVPAEPQPETPAPTPPPEDEVTEEEIAEADAQMTAESLFAPPEPEEDVLLPEEPAVEEGEPAADEAAEYADVPEPEEEEAPEEAPKSRKERRRERKAGKQAESKKKKRHIGLLITAIILSLLVAAVLLYCYTDLGHNLYEYHYEVTELSIEEVGADYITVRVESNAKDGELTLQCQDAYGDSVSLPIGSEPIVFDGLVSDRLYQFRISVDGFHKLTGVTEASAKTLPTTEVLTFAASLAPEEGAAQLSLVVRDDSAEPDEWVVKIYAEGEEKGEQTFVGHSTVVTGLTVGTSYTFRLQNTDLCWLTGQIETTYTPIPQINAINFGMSDLLDGTITLCWRCVPTLPAEWTLSCESPDGETRTQTVTEAVAREDGGYDCTATFDGIIPGLRYTFRLNAEGMYQSLTYELEENVPYVSVIRAEVEEDAIAVSWEGSYRPEGGWRLIITPDNNEAMAFPVQVENGTDYRLEYHSGEQVTLLPDTDYAFTLIAADGTQPFGYTQTAAHSAAASPFTHKNISISTKYTGLYLTPKKEKEDEDEEAWDYRDLIKGKPQTSFAKDDSIEILLYNSKQVEKADVMANILYIIRNADGRIVDYLFDQQNWNEMWATRYWVTHLTRTPQDPGSYRLEIYVSNKLMHAFSFTITE